jgi:hypothetical protein
MEALVVNEEIQDLILHSASEDQIFQTARKNGFMTLKEDAIIKGLQHLIPYEEMNAFGAQIDVNDMLQDISLPVDNQALQTPNPAIIKTNEDTSS